MCARVAGSAAQSCAAWRLAEGALIGAAELAGRGEAGRDGDVEDRKGGFPQQLPRAFEPHGPVLPMDAVAEVTSEEAFELPDRDAGDARQFGAGLRRLDAALHAAKHAQQLLVRHAKPDPQVHALRTHALANLRVQEPVADRSGKVAAMIALDERNHHVERGDSARAGDAVAVDLEQRRRDGNVRKSFAKGWLMLPMQRHPAPVEQTGASEDVGPSGNAADRDAAAGQPAEPREDALVVEGRGVAAGTDKQDVDIAVGAHADVGEDGDAVRCRDRLASGSRVPPAVERPPEMRLAARKGSTAAA